jgi:hypothetical protein
MFYALKTFFGQHYVTYLSVLLFKKKTEILKKFTFKNFESVLLLLFFFSQVLFSKKIL